jgi:glycerate 2-kinase
LETSATFMSSFIVRIVGAMRVLIAPDKFKGTLSAPSAALAMAEGVRRVDPTAVLSSAPVADGGAGTLDALIDAIGGDRHFETAVDPWGARLRTAIGLLSNGDVCVETATSQTGDPLAADSFGLGLLVRRAAELLGENGRVLVAVGGTVSTDGGTGLARALGWTFPDQDGTDVACGGIGLERIAGLEPPQGRQSFPVVGLCDVKAPLTGDGGSARCFAPQKGASPDQVEILESGLLNLARVVRSQRGVDLDKVGYAGAGGGIAAGLHAFAGAELRSGFEFVAEAMRLRALVSSSDFVITGEGRFDEQSVAGKAPVGVARVAHELGIPCLGLFGELGSPPKVALTAGFSDVLSLTDTFGPKAGDEPAARLSEATQLLLSRQPR